MHLLREQHVNSPTRINQTIYMSNVICMASWYCAVSFYLDLLNQWLGTSKMEVFELLNMD